MTTPSKNHTVYVPDGQYTGTMSFNTIVGNIGEKRVVFSVIKGLHEIEIPVRFEVKGGHVFESSVERIDETPSQSSTEPASSPWRDMEHEQPKPNDRVITLVPFGMRVEDNTWDGEEWLNDNGYVSHWMPINAPGSYTEIMQRPRGPKPPRKPCEADRIKAIDDTFSDAMIEHFRMLQSIQWTQVKLRLEAK